MSDIWQWLGQVRCLRRGHVWVRPEYHGHLVSLNATLEEIRAMPRCKGTCARCRKSDCRWDRL